MDVQYLSKLDGQKLAYVYSPGTSPVVMFCGGYRSDMGGTKALYFEERCRARGQGYLRFDYGGHGQSDGAFEEGTIGSWAADAVLMLDEVVEGPVLLVGSSMGGWMAFLVALARPARIAGVIGIAAAPDFTESIYARLNNEQRAEMKKAGYARVPNDYSDQPYHFPLAFYEEAKAHLVLDQGYRFDFPIHLFQGMQDKDVVPETVARIQQAFGGESVKATFLDEGDHRLSTPSDLALIGQKIWDMGGEGL